MKVNHHTQIHKNLADMKEYISNLKRTKNTSTTINSNLTYYITEIENAYREIYHHFIDEQLDYERDL